MVPHRVHHHHFHRQYKRIVSTRSSSIWNLRRCEILHRSALQQPAQQHLLRTITAASSNQPAPAAPSPPNYSRHQHAADYRHNDGLVEGVWIFCRHGDRTPGRALSPAHRRSQEGAFWTSKLPFPDSTAAYEAYCRYFPPEIFPGTNQGRFLDTPRNPFGFLTQKGLGQLKESGHRFFNRYNHHGFHRPGGASNWQWGKAEDFLSVWNVKAYSTNYLRTILSAQSFLDGVLGTHCFIPTAERIFDPDVCEELRLPDHEWKRGDYGDHELVKIHVRELSRDPLNAFDRNPDLMADLVAEVMSGDQFQSRDSVAAPLAARLANILPGLYRPKRSNFASRSPSKINWVEAADHFVCRQSHDLPLARFSDFENDDRVEQTMHAMSHQTKAHLSWRFRQWYLSKRLLAAIAAPPLREISDQMVSTPSLGDTEKRNFTLYSCHDITILGLLYGIGASFLADEIGAEWAYWPPYACTLVFELVRTNEGNYVVRVLLQGKPVVSVDFDDAKRPPLGHGVDNMLRIEDFTKIISKLEEDGGHCATLH